MSATTFTVTLRAVTPVFMGGAKPANLWRLKSVPRQGGGVSWERDGQIEPGVAELRPASLKGLLRFWYRAIDPDYRRHEAAIFGGAGEGHGQSPFAITVRSPIRGSEGWDPSKYAARSAGFTEPAGDLWKNGVTYVGFPLDTRDPREGVERQRVALPADGRTYEVVHHLSRRALDDTRVMKALCAAWWLLCNVGGLGARCRRGLGSVTLASWSPAGVLPGGAPQLPANARDIAQWWSMFTQGLTALRDWYPLAGSPGASLATPDHASIDRDSQFILVPPGHKTWPAGLNAAGRLLQDFRQRRPPDHPAVTAHLQYLDTSGATGTPMSAAPERAAFGLPLPFGSRKLSPRVRAVFQGTTHDRSASRIWLRIVKIQNEYLPLVARLPGPLLPSGEGIVDPRHYDRDGVPVDLGPPADDVLDKFCEWVQKRPGAKHLRGV